MTTHQVGQFGHFGQVEDSQFRGYANPLSSL